MKMYIDLCGWKHKRNYCTHWASVNVSADSETNCSYIKLYFSLDNCIGYFLLIYVALAMCGGQVSFVTRRSRQCLNFSKISYDGGDIDGFCQTVTCASGQYFLNEICNWTQLYLRCTSSAVRYVKPRSNGTYFTFKNNWAWTINNCEILKKWYAERSQAR